MAILSNKAVSGYHQLAIGDFASKGIQWSLDFRRAIIFGKRLNVVSKDTDVKIFGTFSPDTSEHSVITPYRDNIKTNRVKSDITATQGLTQTNIANNNKVSELNNYVSIIDLDYGGFDKAHREIKLPFIPKELEYNCESSFTAIRPMGRNTPFYHFTGAEDKLEFEIDWYAFDSSREEVITKCRQIEALSKADGYNNSPSRVALQWGTGDKLFPISTHTWVILSAPYRMTQFNKGYLNSQGVIVNTHMLPIQAYQKVTLARISSNNLTKVEIEYIQK